MTITVIAPSILEISWVLIANAYNTFASPPSTNAKIIKGLRTTLKMERGFVISLSSMCRDSMVFFIIVSDETIKQAAKVIIAIGNTISLLITQITSYYVFRSGLNLKFLFQKLRTILWNSLRIKALFFSFLVFVTIHPKQLNSAFHGMN